MISKENKMKKIRDFLDIFEKAKEDCKKVAEEEDEEVVDGWVALYRAKLTETERKIVLDACGEGNHGYQNVKNEMLRIVEKEEVNESKEKRKTGWFLQEANCEAIKTNLNPLNKFGKRMRCHKCGSTTHLAYKCKDIVEICWICKSVRSENKIDSQIKLWLHFSTQTLKKKEMTVEGFL